MENSPLSNGSTFIVKNFRQSFFLTWLFLGVGILFLGIFMALSFTVPRKSYFFFFLQNLGIFMAFVTLLLGYAGVYRIVTVPDGTAKITRTSIKATFKKIHYIAGIAFLTAIMITLIILIEAGFSVISQIPVAGPILMALCTIPIQLLNFAVILTAIFIFAIFPPLVSEAGSIKDIIIEIKISIRERWLDVLIYLIISLSILFFAFIILFFLIKYSTGITQAIQWKISAAYPKLLKGITMKSYFTDIIYSITPRASTLGMIKNSGKGMFNPVAPIGYITGLSYLVIFTFFSAFPLALFFNISSVFFGRVKTDK